MIAQFFHVDYSTIGGKILLALSSSNWFKPEAPAYSIGMLVYIVLVVLFAYFYTSITFNPLEVANNMKKSGGFIPGIRPGKPTSDYLNNILNDHRIRSLLCRQSFLRRHIPDHYCRCNPRDDQGCGVYDACKKLQGILK